jgi:hypothetical protein
MRIIASAGPAQGRRAERGLAGAFRRRVFALSLAGPCEPFLSLLEPRRDGFAARVLWGMEDGAGREAPVSVTAGETITGSGFLTLQ